MDQSSVLRLGVDTRDMEEGSRRGRDSLDRLRRSGRQTAEEMRRTERQANLLGAAFAGISAGLVAREFTRMLDATTNINNRLKLVTNTSEQLGQVYDELLTVSNDTRSSLESNAQLFNRTAVATRALGLSYQELIDFTRSMNQAVAISGATSVEASNALIQLSQGMAAGVLRGEELNSVLEQLPKVAEVIADELGVLPGELKELGAEGKISAEDIVNAFKNASGELATQFADMTPTISQAFQVLNNNVLDFVKQTNEATGIAGLMAEAVLLAANNIDVLATAAAGLAIVVGGALTQSFIRLAAAMAFTPLGALAVAAGTATVALGLLGDESFKVGEQTATGWQIAQAAWRTSIPILDAVAEAAKKDFGVFRESLKELAPAARDTLDRVLSFFDLTFSDIVAYGRDNINTLVGLFIGSRDAIIAGWNALPSSFKQIGSLAVSLLLDAIEGGVQGALSGIDRILTFVGSLAEKVGKENPFSGLVNPDDFSLDKYKPQLEGEAAEAGAAIRGAFTNAMGKDYVGDAVGQASQFLGTLKGDFADNLSDVTDEAAAAADQASVLDEVFQGGSTSADGLADALGGTAKGAGAASRAAKKAAKEFEDFKDEINDAYREVRGESGHAVEAVQDWYNETSATLRSMGLEHTDYADKLDVVFRSRLKDAYEQDVMNRKGWMAGIEQSLVEIPDFATAQTEMVKSSFDTMFGGLSDGFAEFARTGKLDFKSMTSSILGDMAAIIAKSTAMSAIKGVFGGIGGGGGVLGGVAQSIAGMFSEGGTSSAPVQTTAMSPAMFAGAPHYAEGTPNTSGGIPAILHDNEAVVPLSRGREIPVKMKEGQGGSVTNVFHIQTPDVEGFRRSQSQIEAQLLRSTTRGQRNT